MSRDYRESQRWIRVILTDCPSSSANYDPLTSPDYIEICWLPLLYEHLSIFYIVLQVTWYLIVYKVVIYVLLSIKNRGISLAKQTFIRKEGIVMPQFASLDLMWFE